MGAREPMPHVSALLKARAPQQRPRAHSSAPACAAPRGQRAPRGRWRPGPWRTQEPHESPARSPLRILVEQGDNAATAMLHRAAGFRVIRMKGDGQLVVTFLHRWNLCKLWCACARTTLCSTRGGGALCRHASVPDSLYPDGSLPYTGGHAAASRPPGTVTRGDHERAACRARARVVP